ncbi:MAG: translation initiation factor [Candidatus Omnitrophica bacterium]|nr:translation initiation factor [Candidatus Omnitrophota bacterium]
MNKPKPGKVRVYLDTHLRRGKEVTIVEGLRHHPQMIEDIAAELKRALGAGGTVRAGRIEIQGDHRDKVSEKLTAMGYNAEIS